MDDQILETAHPEPEWRFRDLRAESDSREIYGLVVPYNVETTIGGRFRELVTPGVFGDTSQLNTFMTRQHKRELTLGRTGRNVSFRDTPEGLEMRADMPNTPLGEDTLYLVRDGILTGLSVEWLVKKERWQMGKVPVRTILESGLRHFSVVDSPEYETTLVHARAKQHLDELLGIVVVPEVIPEETPERYPRPKGASRQTPEPTPEDRAERIMCPPRNRSLPGGRFFRLV